MRTTMPAARVSFKLTILTLFVVLTVGLSTVVLWVSYRRNSEATLQTADRLLENAAGRIVAATDQMIEPLFGVTNSAVLVPAVDAAAGTRGENALTPLLLAVLGRYPQIISAYLGNDRGEFYRVVSLTAMREAPRAFLKPPADAVFAVQTIGAERGRRIERWRFLDTAKRELASHEDSGGDYDPRRRPWYAAARKSAQAIVTDYYVYASAPQIGLTVARQVGDAKGTVFGADLTLTSISRYLATVRASHLAAMHNAEIAIFTLDGRLLAHSDNATYEHLLNAGDTPRIPNVREVGSGVVAGIAGAYQPGAPAGLRLLRPHGVEWMAHVAPLSPAFGEGTYLAVAVPVNDVLGPLARTARQTLLVSLLVVLGFLPVVYLAADAVSAPLRRLAREIAVLQNFDAAPKAPVASRIAEIQDLAQALATARSMLAAFGKYVPKNLVRQLVGTGTEPRLGGERRTLTVLFTDVRDFTTVSEKLAPEQLMQLTSEYLEGLVKIVLENRGTVDKFVGDQVMAYWNAPTPNPSHIWDGCRALLRCCAWSNAQNARWAREGHPTFYTRFGLHVGDAIVGNVGSSDRMDYTVVGATINLGSRIEGLNKIYGTQVLVTGPVADAVGKYFVCRPVDRVLPKGAVHPLDVFELKGVHPQAGEANDIAVGSAAVALCETWSSFYRDYLRRDWQACARSLSEFVARFGEDDLARLYAARLEQFRRAPPPSDWDGVIRYATK